MFQYTSKGLIVSRRGGVFEKQRNVYSMKTL